MQHSLLLSFAMICVAFTNSFAAVVGYDFGGVIAESGWPEINVGDSFTGRFFYDTGMPLATTVAGIAIYRPASSSQLFEFSVNVSGQTLAIPDTGRVVEVQDDGPFLEPGLFDGFAIGRGDAFASVGGVSYLLLVDSSHSVFDGTELPTSLLLSSFDNVQFVYARQGGALTKATGQISYLVAVPEPSAATCALLGVAIGVALLRGSAGPATGSRKRTILARMDRSKRRRTPNTARMIG